MLPVATTGADNSTCSPVLSYRPMMLFFFAPVLNYTFATESKIDKRWFWMFVGSDY